MNWKQGVSNEETFRHYNNLMKSFLRFHKESNPDNLIDLDILKLKQMRTVIEKSVEVQKIKYHYKMDNGHSISKEDLSDKIKTKYTIQSPNQKLIDFI